VNSRKPLRWRAFPRRRRPAIDVLARGPVDAAAVDRFLERHQVPIVAGRSCTFLFRGEADDVRLVQRITGDTSRLPLHRLRGTDLWYVVLDLQDGSRVNYQFEMTRGGHVECVNDPLNPRRSHSPLGSSSVCFARGYQTPAWTQPDPEAPAGQLTDVMVQSRALDRDCTATLYLPPGLRTTRGYPLLLVHDGGDFLQYAAAKTVLDNLIHQHAIAETVVAFLHPKDRLTEYANSPAHADFVTDELLPQLEREYPLSGRRSDRCLLGSSFGAAASLSTAYRSPDTYGSLVLMSGSFVFTDAGADHGGGPAFDPVVAFVNRYREQPRRLADRIYLSCGVYEPLIVRNRAMRPVFESTGTEVRYVEARDGHSWENWRDRLRDALSWVLPGPNSAWRHR